MDNNIMKKIIEKIKKNIRVIYILAGFVVLIVILLLILSLIRQSKTSQFNFSKGFLAINIDKSIYAPNESVEFGMGTLDPKGNTLCHSNLEILITGPDGQKISLTTANGKISNTCSEDASSSNGLDYRSSFVPEKEGTYDIRLTNLDTKMVVKDQISVKSNQKFSIQRTGPTRMDPFKKDRYPMILTITSQGDFRGQLVDQIPSSFDVLWQGPSEINTVKDYKTITWNVDLKAGETKEFIYEFQAPKASPKFYTMGKANLIQNNEKAFEETRLWEIIVGGSLN